MWLTASATTSVLMLASPNSMSKETLPKAPSLRERAGKWLGDMLFDGLTDFSVAIGNTVQFFQRNNIAEQNSSLSSAQPEAANNSDVREPTRPNPDHNKQPSL